MNNYLSTWWAGAKILFVIGLLWGIGSVVVDGIQAVL